MKLAARVNRQFQLTFTDTIYLSVGTGLLISATREHGNGLLLISLFLSEVIWIQAGPWPMMSQTAKE